MSVIRVPADYIDVIKKAQPVSEFGEYTYEYLNHEYFRDFSDLEKYKSIRPGFATSDPVVNDIVALQYANNEISYKLNFEDDWTPLPEAHIKKGDPLFFPSIICYLLLITFIVYFSDWSPPNVPLKQLYETRLPITKTKYEHLQALKKILPADFHSFYDNIPYGKAESKTESSSSSSAVDGSKVSKKKVGGSNNEKKVGASNRKKKAGDTETRSASARIRERNTTRNELLKKSDTTVTGCTRSTRSRASEVTKDVPKKQAVRERKK